LIQYDHFISLISFHPCSFFVRVEIGAFGEVMDFDEVCRVAEVRKCTV
jgi:hypothetical protein